MVRFNTPLGLNPDATVVTYVTHRDTHSYTDSPSANHSGLYRNPLPLSNGTVVAVHTAETRSDTNAGTRQNPLSRYAFRMKTLAAAGGVFTAGSTLTPGISKSVSWWDPDVLVSYSGPLWELDPVEVRARTKPVRATTLMAPPVQQVFAQQGVAVPVMRNYLLQKGLALIVSNNVTTRDRSDRQQPFNLRVAGGGATPASGRRVLAQYMHDPAVSNPLLTGAPSASVAIAPDGSAAAFVSARRAMSWQLTAPEGCRSFVSATG